MAHSQRFALRPTLCVYAGRRRLYTIHTMRLRLRQAHGGACTRESLLLLSVCAAAAAVLFQ